jgi:hypothetical protein
MQTVMSRIDLKLLVVALHLIVALAYSHETCESDVQTLISANNSSKGKKFHLKVKNLFLSGAKNCLDIRPQIIIPDILIITYICRSQN